MDARTTGIIYLAKCGKFFKIGRTQDLDKRFKSLLGGNCCQYRFIQDEQNKGNCLEIVHSFKVKNMEASERALQQLLRKFMRVIESDPNRSTEWFEFPPEVVKDLCSLNSMHEPQILKEGWLRGDISMKNLTKEEFLDLLQDRVDQVGTQRAAADSLGITYGHLNDVLHNRKEPGEKILANFSLREVKSVSYQSTQPDEEKENK